MLLVYAVSSRQTLGMLTSTVLWQVRSWPRWYLFKTTGTALEMTSWHKTRHRWQVWEAAKLQVCVCGGGHWVRPCQVIKQTQRCGKYEEYLICVIFSQRKGLKFQLLNVFSKICDQELLQNSSMLSGAEKLNSTGLRRHDSLFSPHSLSQLPSTLRSWWTVAAWKKWHYLFAK